MHVIDQLINALVEHLKDSTDAGQRVYADHAGPFESTDPPYIEVMYDSDGPAEAGGSMGVQSRDVHIDFRLVAKGKTARSDVMAIRSDIESIFPSCNLSLQMPDEDPPTDRMFPTVMNDVDFDKDDESDSISREITMQYQFFVQYPTGDPEQFA